MNGERDLATLLATLEPVLHGEEWVFCSLPPDQAAALDIPYLGRFREAEGETLIAPRGVAERWAIAYTYPCRLITLNVHSSLAAVGFLAAITAKLAAANISVNPVSAYYHDHLLVPREQAEQALSLLSQFPASPQGR